VTQDPPLHVTASDASGSALTSHVPPAQSTAQRALSLHSIVQPPVPPHDIVQIAPSPHLMSQFPDGHCRSHVAPLVQLHWLPLVHATAIGIASLAASTIATPSPSTSPDEPGAS
jgi:hypothetical protein